MRERLGLGELLDDAADLAVRTLPDRSALAVLAVLPLRLLQVWFLDRLIELGPGAIQHGRYLATIAGFLTAALVPAFWGRAELARACQSALGGEGWGVGRRARLGIGWRRYLLGLYAALVAAALLPAAGWGIVTLPLLALAPGIAAATCPYQERPGLFAPLGVAARGFSQPRLLIGLLFSGALAVLAAFVNLFALFQLGLFAARAASGLDLAWWGRALSIESRLFDLLVAAGALLLVEPLWIAALSVLVHRGRARANGDDLAAWIAEVRSGEAGRAAA
ncbi:MAG TPA: hypothetical protein VN783_09255 [Thermoanaerobaculia bacterium]|nr:hypothetical protein [Thermoanaerobaculia bacterium]